MIIKISREISHLSALIGAATRRKNSTGQSRRRSDCSRRDCAKDERRNGSPYQRPRIIERYGTCTSLKWIGGLQITSCRNSIIVLALDHLKNIEIFDHSSANRKKIPGLSSDRSDSSPVPPSSSHTLDLTGSSEMVASGRGLRKAYSLNTMPRHQPAPALASVRRHPRLKGQNHQALYP